MSITAKTTTPSRRTSAICAKSSKTPLMSPDSSRPFGELDIKLKRSLFKSLRAELIFYVALSMFLSVITELVWGFIF